MKEPPELQESDLVHLMHCHQIRPGMIFYWPKSKVVWEVIEEGTYAIVDGVRKPISNLLKSKWWCRKIKGSHPAMLICFDQIFNNRELYHFRWSRLPKIKSKK